MMPSQTLVNPAVPGTAINIAPADRSLVREINERTGQNIGRCYQCRSCANGCPFLGAMDYSPNAVLRLIQYGWRREVLGCSTIWLCVGCQACSSQCPNAIDLAAVMDALRQMAQADGVPVPQPEIFYFHQEVLRSLKRYGRTHKLGVMWRHKLLTRRWFSDLDVGLKMLVKRKLELKPSRIKGVAEIEPFFKAPREG